MFGEQNQKDLTREKNREAARRSRVRRAQKVVELEQEIQQLSSKNDSLTQAIQIISQECKIANNLKSECENLLKMIQQLKTENEMLKLRSCQYNPTCGTKVKMVTPAIENLNFPDYNNINLKACLNSDNFVNQPFKNTNNINMSPPELLPESKLFSMNNNTTRSTSINNSNFDTSNNIPNHDFYSNIQSQPEIQFQHQLPLLDHLRYQQYRNVKEEKSSLPFLTNSSQTESFSYSSSTNQNSLLKNSLELPNLINSQDIKFSNPEDIFPSRFDRKENMIINEPSTSNSSFIFLKSKLPFHTQLPSQLNYDLLPNPPNISQQQNLSVSLLSSSSSPLSVPRFPSPSINQNYSSPTSSTDIQFSSLFSDLTFYPNSVPLNMPSVPPPHRS